MHQSISVCHQFLHLPTESLVLSETHHLDLPVVVVYAWPYLNLIFNRGSSLQLCSPHCLYATVNTGLFMIKPELAMNKVIVTQTGIKWLNGQFLYITVSIHHSSMLPFWSKEWVQSAVFTCKHYWLDSLKPVGMNIIVWQVPTVQDFCKPTISCWIDWLLT